MTAKSANKKPTVRKLKVEPYRSLRLQSKIKHQAASLPPARRLLKTSMQMLLKRWKLFGGIVGIYILLTILMVQGMGVNTGLDELKSSLQEVFSGRSSSLLTGLTIFGYLLSSSGSSSGDVASLYQSILLVIVSLATVWALRQVQAGHKASVADAFYKGMYPLIPFVLVLMVIGLQLLPLVFGNWLYGIVINGGIAITTAEKGLWMVFTALLALLSLYMLSSSLFAIYISTLPEMRPIKALRSARELVRNRRWLVMRRVILLPILLMIFGAVIMVPAIIIITPIASWLFLVLSMMSLVVVHAYMYNLYRELL